MPDRTAGAMGAGLAILGGLILASLAGAPIGAAILALAGGLVAGALVLIKPSPVVSESPAPTASVPASPVLPDAGAILGSVDEPMLIVRNRRVLMANEAARKLLGEHIEGVDVRLAIRHPAAAERLASAAPDEPTDMMVKTELVGIGDRDRRWEMATTLLEDGSRLVRLTDRSDVHATEQMRGDFVANASHELRTPLATLLGFLETLEDEDAASDPKVRTRFLGIMTEEARRMQQLVDDLISLSRIEAERFSAPRESVALLPLIDEVRTGCRHVIEEKASAIEIDNGEIAPAVLGDRSQLLQLVQNLVINALKYGRAGTPVRIRFDDAGPDMLRMAVIDEGEGVAPEHLPRLTERFYRVDAGRSRSVGGTGLGLAIVKHIVSRHRGRLEFRSTLGKGTSVRVYMPKAPAESAEPVSSNSHTIVT